jgi:hypothetical protein
VDNHGVMKGISPGSATIMLHGGKYDAKVDVTVIPSG